MRASSRSYDNVILLERLSRSLLRQYQVLVSTINFKFLCLSYEESAYSWFSVFSLYKHFKSMQSKVRAHLISSSTIILTYKYILIKLYTAREDIYIINSGYLKSVITEILKSTVIIRRSKGSVIKSCQ